MVGRMVNVKLDLTDEEMEALLSLAYRKYGVVRGGLGRILTEAARRFLAEEQKRLKEVEEKAADVRD